MFSDPESRLIDHVDGFLKMHSQIAKSQEGVPGADYDSAVRNMAAMGGLTRMPDNAKRVLDAAIRVKIQWDATKADATEKATKPGNDFFDAIEKLKDARRAYVEPVPETVVAAPVSTPRIVLNVGPAESAAIQEYRPSSAEKMATVAISAAATAIDESMANVSQNTQT